MESDRFCAVEHIYNSLDKENDKQGEKFADIVNLIQSFKGWDCIKEGSHETEWSINSWNSVQADVKKNTWEEQS